MTFTDLAPCLPPWNIPALWFFAGGSALILLAAWGSALLAKSQMDGHYRERPLPPRVDRVEPRVEPTHAHQFIVKPGANFGRCECSVTAAVIVEEAE